MYICSALCTHVVCVGTFEGRVNLPSPERVTPLFTSSLHCLPHHCIAYLTIWSQCQLNGALLSTNTPCLSHTSTAHWSAQGHYLHLLFTNIPCLSHTTTGVHLLFASTWEHWALFKPIVHQYTQAGALATACYGLPIHPRWSCLHLQVT